LWRNEKLFAYLKVMRKSGEVFRTVVRRSIRQKPPK
jgi:hypothetical protein